jgi:hypothetical protein
MMTELAALWLPILLSAVFVFIASSIIHMVLGAWHKGDYPRIPNEAAVMDALRPFAVPPGDYMVPSCDNMKEFGSPAFAEKLAKGPVMIVTMLPNAMMSMGRNLGLWFAYCLIVGIFTAYGAGVALPPHADTHLVLRLASVIAFMGYAAALWQMTIWYRRALLTTVKSTIDGLVYALITGATFAWLWP